MDRQTALGFVAFLAGVHCVWYGKALFFAGAFVGCALVTLFDENLEDMWPLAAYYCVGLATGHTQVQTVLAFVYVGHTMLVFVATQK